MPHSFLCYRRNDTAGHTGRLYADLVREFDEESVFFDLKSVPPGLDFRTEVRRNILDSSVVLVMIGKSWKPELLQNEEDYVRDEIATALGANKRVVPVLVQGATMPRPEEFPEPLREVAYRNASELSDRHWDADVRSLVKVIEGAAPRGRRSRSFGALLLVGVPIVLALALAGASVMSMRSAAKRDRSTRHMVEPAVPSSETTTSAAPSSTTARPPETTTTAAPETATVAPLPPPVTATLHDPPAQPPTEPPQETTTSAPPETSTVAPPVTTTRLMPPVTATFRNPGKFDPSRLIVARAVSARTGVVAQYAAKAGAAVSVKVTAPPETSPRMYLARLGSARRGHEGSWLASQLAAGVQTTLAGSGARELVLLLDRRTNAAGPVTVVVTVGSDRRAYTLAPTEPPTSNLDRLTWRIDVED